MNRSGMNQLTVILTFRGFESSVVMRFYLKFGAQFILFIGPATLFVHHVGNSDVSEFRCRYIQE